MKLVVNNTAFIDANGNPLTEVVKECSVDGALTGHQCDAIMLNLVDIARLQKLSHIEMREWLSKMQTKIRISFDPRIVP